MIFKKLWPKHRTTSIKYCVISCKQLLFSEENSQMKLICVQLRLAGDSQLPNFYLFGYIGVCIFLQNLAETRHVKQATLAMKSVVI